MLYFYVVFSIVFVTNFDFSSAVRQSLLSCSKNIIFTHVSFFIVFLAYSIFYLKVFGFLFQKQMSFVIVFLTLLKRTIELDFL